MKVSKSKMAVNNANTFLYKIVCVTFSTIFKHAVLPWTGQNKLFSILVWLSMKNCYVNIDNLGLHCPTRVIFTMSIAAMVKSREYEFS